MSKYTILCPSCHGTRTQSDGLTCQETDCLSGGIWRGYKKMRRCPASYQDADLIRALRAWALLRRYNSWPVTGGTLDQAASFLSFVTVIEAGIENAQGDK